MSSFLKSIFHSSNKHKKLCEEWTNNREPVVDGVTFYVRYLGSSAVEDPKSASSTAAGVKRVIHAAKGGTRRPDRVSFRVAMEGVRIDSIVTGETIMDTSIYKISYCSADSQYDQVLAFVASNADETCECHAFLCSKRKVAEAIAVSIAQAFTMAYECWKLALEAKRNGQQRDDLTADQLSIQSGESPRRGSKGDSRASSPGHSPSRSSPPSEVSSTSGYQSSIPGGLLLELDYTDGGSAGALPSLADQQPLPVCTAARKHWTSFDDVSDLPDSFSRLNSDRAKQSNPWDPCAKDSIAASCGSAPPGCPGWRNLHPPASGLTESSTTTVELCATVPSTSASAAVATPSLTQNKQNSSSTRLSLPSGTECSAFTDVFQPFRKDCRTNPINLPDINFTNKTNMTNFSCHPEYNVNGTKMCILHNSDGRSRRIVESTNSFSRGVKSGSAVPNCNDCNAWQHVETDSSPNRGISVPRKRWESFDSSPPAASPISPLNFHSLSNPLYLSSNLSYVSNPSIRRPQSPISAFLDSCLTPRPEDDDDEDSKFAFIGCLSGEGRSNTDIFSSTTTVTDSFANGEFFSGTSNLSENKHCSKIGTTQSGTRNYCNGGIGIRQSKNSTDSFNSQSSLSQSEEVR